MRYILFLLLAGCATTGANVTGNSASVTVNNVWNRNQAFGFADKHCAQYGKVARASGDGEDYAFTFDCVAP